jgi:hypothetical protein
LGGPTRREWSIAQMTILGLVARTLGAVAAHAAHPQGLRTALATNKRSNSAATGHYGSRESRPNLALCRSRQGSGPRMGCGMVPCLAWVLDSVWSPALGLGPCPTRCAGRTGWWSRGVSLLTFEMGRTSWSSRLLQLALAQPYEQMPRVIQASSATA